MMNVRYVGLAAKAGLAIFASVLLASCGGGGGSADAITGTAARGAPLAGAAVRITCPAGNGDTITLTGTTGANGSYATDTRDFNYPCLGTAVAATVPAGGTITYRGVLFSGSTMNFSPLTDLLVGVVLAAAGSGTSTLTFDQFLVTVRSNESFANAIVSNAGTYRGKVIEALQDLGATPAQLAGIPGTNFESVSFTATDGNAQDDAIERLAPITQNPNGSVRDAARTEANSEGNEVTAPTGAPTGATGAGG